MYSILFVLISPEKTNLLSVLGSTENQVCPQDSDEDLGKLHNKDMLKQVGRLVLSLVFFFFLLEFSIVFSYLLSVPPVLF